MCGRYSNSRENAELMAALGIAMPAPPCQYNVAPTQWAPVITATKPDKIQLFRWGLIPSWAKDEAIGLKMINARSETLIEKPVFRTAVKRRRCLVLADGFYEWKRNGGKAQPFRLTLKSGSPFAFAGLWDHWQRPDGAELWSYTIITTEPNELAAQIHNRMPVILGKDESLRWLEGTPEESRHLECLKAIPASAMKSYPVHPMVNRAGLEDPSCVEEFREKPKPEQLSLL
ncbi:MAG: SOS response-associated peptidase [Verrucomicrobiales bacterium]